MGERCHTVFSDSYPMRTSAYPDHIAQLVLLHMQKNPARHTPGRGITYRGGERARRILFLRHSDCTQSKGQNVTSHRLTYSTLNWQNISVDCVLAIG